MTTMTQLSSAHRFLIARANDLAIDVSLAGKYEAHTSFSPHCWDFSVSVCHIGDDATSAIYRQHAYLDWESGSHAADNALPDMLAKLEGLLADSVPEGQPS